MLLHVGYLWRSCKPALPTVHSAGVCERRRTLRDGRPKTIVEASAMSPQAGIPPGWGCGPTSVGSPLTIVLSCSTMLARSGYIPKNKLGARQTGIADFISQSELPGGLLYKALRGANRPSPRVERVPRHPSAHTSEVANRFPAERRTGALSSRTAGRQV
jgi:hypothetical protein